MFLSGEFIVEDVIKPTKANGWKKKLKDWRCFICNI